MLYILLYRDNYFLIYPNLNEGTFVHNLNTGKVEHTREELFSLKCYHKSEACPEFKVIEDPEEINKILVLKELVN